MKVVFLSLWLLAFFLTAASKSAVSDEWCKPQKPPSISIRTSTDQISYDFSKSEKQLNNFHITTKNPYANNVITDVGGVMKGGIEAQQKMSFGTLKNQHTNQICFWYDSIDVLIHIKPTIFIASEFPPATCMHNAIMEHEQKHIQVDREIVNKYAALIGNAFKEDLTKYSVFGPFPLSNEQVMIDQIKSRMQNILKYYTNQMSIERQSRQQEIDNLSEYQRVNKSCPAR